MSSHNTYEKLKNPNQTITKANPHKTGTTPIKWLPHSSANCTWTVTLYWPLHRPTVPMGVNTGLLVLWTTQLFWSLKKTLNHLTLRPPTPPLSWASSQILLQQQWLCRGTARQGVMAFGAQTSWHHEGWQLASETGHYFYWKQTSLSKAPHTIVVKQKTKNPLQILYKKWHSSVLKEWRGGSQK